MRAFVRRHAVAVGLGTALVVAGLVFVAVWFQPQRLLYDTTVRDVLPTAAPVTAPVSGAPAASAPVPAAAPRVLASGLLGDRSHHASGAVRALALPDGTRVLRLEGLDVENGPDLFVLLAEADAAAAEEAYESRTVSLGRLKGNKGDQTYVIPAGVDLARYRSVVIWCRRFAVAFGTAAIRA